MIDKIIICDDDEFTLQIMKDDLIQVISQFKLDFHIIATVRSFSELQSFLNQHQENYLYFMDFDFGVNQLNGIDAAHFIKQNSPTAKIIFVTSHTEMAMSILKSGTEPFGFIEKVPNRHQMLDKYHYYLEMARPAQTTSTKKTATLPIPIGVDEIIELPLNKILYIDTALDLPHHICFHTNDNSQLTVRWTIKGVLSKLPSFFIRTHRSIIVNCQFITSLKHGQLRLANGVFLPCSRKQQKKVKALLTYEVKNDNFNQ